MDYKLPNEKGAYRRADGIQLPLGVTKYTLANGDIRFCWRGWDANNDKIPGKWGYEDPHQASYDRSIALYGHHWEDMPKEIDNYFGFVYTMTDRETGKIYIGSKQFMFWNGPRGGYKCTTPMDKEFFDPTLWVPSDWPQYTSSSRLVNKMASQRPWSFEYKVLHLAKSKLELHLLEIQEQVDRNVLQALDEDGEYVYLNENIMGVEYRPPVPRGQLYAAKAEAERQVRDYYLRPEVCSKCNRILPYGETKCCYSIPQGHEQLIGS